MHILVVKTSSLGDIVHALPALTDAACAVPGLRCDWLVERPFAEIPAWHPSVDRVIVCDLRALRSRPLGVLFGGEWTRFRKDLRNRDYDLVIDAQGLLKSAWLGWQSRGPLCGPDAVSAREPPAAYFYGRRFSIPAHTAAHAVERARRLFASALDYTLPDLNDAPDYGLEKSGFIAPDLDRPYAVLLHGTTWASKRWSTSHWRMLGRWLATQGVRVVLPWGSGSERDDALAIAQGCDGLVLPRQNLTSLAGWLAHARVVVGVDTGLMHLAAALGTPGVSLYGPTLPQLTGAMGRHQVWLRSDETAATIDRERRLEIAPERVRSALIELLSAAS